MLPNRKSDMTRSRPITFLATAGVMPLGAVAIAACGGGGATAAAPPTASQPPAKTLTKQSPPFRLAHSRLGQILVNSGGRTLYLFKGDSGNWRLARTGAGATLAYPLGWTPIKTDPGTASVALLRGDRIDGYLNATPRQGTETLADWSHFRLHHNQGEGDRDERLVAATRDGRFRSGRGACVIDTYSTSKTTYREIACLVSSASSSAVVVAAAPRSEFRATGWHAGASRVELCPVSETPRRSYLKPQIKDLLTWPGMKNGGRLGGWATHRRGRSREAEAPCPARRCTSREMRGGPSAESVWVPSGYSATGASSNEALMCSDSARAAARCAASRSWSSWALSRAAE